MIKFEKDQNPIQYAIGLAGWLLMEKYPLFAGWLIEIDSQSQKQIIRIDAFHHKISEQSFLKFTKT